MSLKNKHNIFMSENKIIYDKQSRKTTQRSFIGFSVKGVGEGELQATRLDLDFNMDLLVSCSEYFNQFKMQRHV